MMPLIDLGPGYSIPRIILGGWQLSAGHANRDLERGELFTRWDAFLDQGFNTFDCADIYTGVEATIGEYVRRRLAAGQAPPQVHTKFVPDLAALPTLDRRGVERIIDRSLARLGLERLDLVQFHWWDYRIERYVETLGHLGDLARDGKIRLVGLTNFDTPRLQELLATGVPIASMQLQYSVLDQRAARGLAAACQGSNVALLCYGTLAGGFLSGRWLGLAEPADLPNRSLVKYRLVIDELGGWAVFQRILAALTAIAERHGVEVSAVAARVILDRPGVAAVIVGMPSAERAQELRSALALRLTDADRVELAEATGPAPGPIGDVYTAERDVNAPHAAIMRYDLNAQPGDA